MSRLLAAMASVLVSPVASPVGGAAPALFGPVTGEWEPFRVPKTPSLEGSVLPSPGGAAVVGSARRERLRSSLAERDWATLHCVARHRFLATEQLQRFVFQGHASASTAARTTRRVLSRLARDGLLRSLPRRQGGPLGGSTPSVWQLAPAGARLLRGEGASVPTTRFLAHCLAVAEAHLAVLAAATAKGWTANVEIESEGARPYTGAGGEQLTLRPDICVRVTGEDADGRFEDAWFIEVDLGTESLPTLLKKCAQYEAYRAQGIEQAAHGSFPLVLWLLTHTSRAEELGRRVRRTPSLTPALYRYAQLDATAIHHVLTSQNGEPS